MTAIARMLSLVLLTAGLQACVSYQTSCGTGEFTYEPYPAVLPAGAPQPPIYPIRDDAHCLRPGSTIAIENLDFAYSDLATIQRLDLAILHTRWDPNAQGNTQGIWRRLTDPTFIEITDFSRRADGTLDASIPGGITGEPPAAATIRMTYVDDSGAVREVDIEADRREDVYDHGLFFVPAYRVYLAEADIGIGFDLFDRTVEDTVFPTFAQVFGGGWEEYCRIRYTNFSVRGFDGTPEFIPPHAQTRVPTQRYRVRVPSTQTGTLTIQYQVVCPDDVDPTGRNWFSNWGLLGDYTLDIGQSLIRGMPPIGGVDRP